MLDLDDVNSVRDMCQTDTLLQPQIFILAPRLVL